MSSCIALASNTFSSKKYIPPLIYAMNKHVVECHHLWVYTSVKHNNYCCHRCPIYLKHWKHSSNCKVANTALRRTQDYHQVPYCHTKWSSSHEWSKQFEVCGVRSGDLKGTNFYCKNFQKFKGRADSHQKVGEEGLTIIVKVILLGSVHMYVGSYQKVGGSLSPPASPPLY